MNARPEAPAVEKRFISSFCSDPYYMFLLDDDAGHEGLLKPKALIQIP